MPEINEDMKVIPMQLDEIDTKLTQLTVSIANFIQTMEPVIKEAIHPQMEFPEDAQPVPPLVSDRLQRISSTVSYLKSCLDSNSRNSQL